MDMARALEKWADRIYIILLVLSALWWASRHDATTQVQEVATKLETVTGQVNQAFQQMQTRVSALETAAAPKPAVK